MAIHKSVGNSGDYAEIIIDYEKKGIKLIDSVTKKEMKDSWALEFRPGAFTFFMMVILAGTILFWFHDIFLGLGIPLFIYIISVVSTPIRRKLKIHKFVQWLQHEFFSQKKYMIVKAQDIKGRVWQLPYEFTNQKMDYNLYGDCSKQIKRIHIRPKPWMWKSRSNKIEQQEEDWDVFFYFRNKPKTGRIELTWI